VRILGNNRVGKMDLEVRLRVAEAAGLDGDLLMPVFPTPKLSDVLIASMPE
jgi:hypothetical protein